MVYEHYSWKADYIATSNRADAVLQARLRSGHIPLLKAYAHLLDPAVTVPGGAASIRTLAAEMPKPQFPPATHLW